MNVGIMVRTIEEKQGIGLYTLYLLDNLLQIDKENKYTLFYRTETHFSRYEKYPNVESVLVRAPTKLFWDQVAIPLMAKKHNLDVLYNTKFSVPLFATCPTAMVMHGSEWFVYPEHYKPLDVKYQKLMMSRYLKKASLVISVSDRAKFDMAKFAKGDLSKFRTIYLAANDRFRVIKDQNYLNEIREKYHLPKEFIIWVGRIYPGKNIGNLIKAYSKISGSIPHKLVLVGRLGWYYENDLRLIDDLNLHERVIFKEWVEPEELPTFYNLASALAFPSWYESCPAPPWEAMACACPVVTTKTGGTPEVVGEAAIYVDPSNPEQIGEGLLKVLKDNLLRQQLIEKGFKQVKRFTWEKCANETLQALQSLVTK